MNRSGVSQADFIANSNIYSSVHRSVHRMAMSAEHSLLRTAPRQLHAPALKTVAIAKVTSPLTSWSVMGMRFVDL